MKFDSPLFDRIRVKPTEDRRRTADAPCCDWKGCGNTATHRAPKGRTRENEYWRFCLEHVREYNHSYNYFSGMSDDAVLKYQKDAITGHRPTWKMGTGNHPGPELGTDAARDPFNVFREFGARTKSAPAEPPRAIRNAERKALHELGLEVGAGKAEIKARFKLLVKRHHPDANGGDRAMEDKLREIIQAYNYLKSAGALK
jgi:curved DNA-binding protein CbpA